MSPLTAFATSDRAPARSTIPSAINVAQVVLSTRSPAPDASGPVTMPAFGAAYSDAEIAAVANYVTSRFGRASSAVT